MAMMNLTERELDLLVAMVQAEEKRVREERLELQADGDMAGAGEKSAEGAELKELRAKLLS